MRHYRRHAYVGLLLPLACLLGAALLAAPTAPRIADMQSVSNGIELTIAPCTSNGTTEWLSISQSTALQTNRWRVLNVTPWTMNGTGMSWTDYLGDDAGNTRFYRLAINGDADHDGLPDWWELQYSAGPTNMVPDDDPDHDTWNNRQEYMRGGNPTNRWTADTNNLLQLQVFTPLR